MAANGDYRVLVLTSDAATIGEVTEIARRNFENTTVLRFEAEEAELVEAGDLRLGEAFVAEVGEGWAVPER